MQHSPMVRKLKFTISDLMDLKIKDTLCMGHGLATIDKYFVVIVSEQELGLYY